MLAVTWNVNSLNARMPRVLEFLEQHEPDIVCLQETKCAPDQYPHLELQACGYQSIDHSGGRWAGVALLARDDAEVSNVQIGLPGGPIPDEARWIEATIDGVHAVSTYVINGRTLDDPMYAAKLEFLDAAVERMREFADTDAFVAGDFNVAPRDEDVYDIAAFIGGTHVTEAERSRITKMQDLGFHDAFLQAPERGAEAYTWWDYRAGHFHRNLGLRIDLILASTTLSKRLEWVGIDRNFRKGQKPSDHAPLMARLT